jgi:DNA-binding MarR family transcriptional regulator
MAEAKNVEQIALVLREFWAELVRATPGAMLQVMRRADLSLPQLVALLYVQRRAAVTISEIGAHLNLSLGATSHLVDRLVERGLVERAEGRSDRRQKRVSLTAAGRAFVEEAQQARVDEMARTLTQLPAPLLERMLDDLAGVVAYLRALEPAAPEHTALE